MAKVKKFEEIQSWKKARSLTNKIYQALSQDSLLKTLVFGIKYGAQPYPFCQISLKVSNVVVIKNSCSFLRSQRDRPVKYGRNCTSL